MNYANLFDELQQPAELDAQLRGRAASHLSDCQNEAVSCPPFGSVVVVAGPGSGKTTVLVERIGHLLASGARPDQLLVCTFTRAAADEMQSRLAPKVKGGRLPYCGTMHGLAYRMLGGEQWLLKNGLSLISDEDQLTLLHSLLLEAGLEQSLSDKELLLALQRAQEGASVPAEYLVLARAWEAHLQELGYVDFVMLLKHSLALPSRRKFRFALVDEAQDLTPLQLQWLANHCTENAHVFLVGDDDQAVYAFRGAAQSVLADEVARGARCIQLRDNWRCRKLVIDHARQLISHNSNRVALAQVATRPDGDVMVVRFRTEDEELSELRQMPVPPVVLCRTRQEVDCFTAAGFEAHTMHESKGREWPFVWVSGLEQGVCPHGMGNPEEERRLCYVAMTRAKDRLRLSVRDSVGGRKRFPSTFLAEAGLA